MGFYMVIQAPCPWLSRLQCVCDWIKLLVRNLSATEVTHNHRKVWFESSMYELCPWNSPSGKNFNHRRLLGNAFVANGGIGYQIFYWSMDTHSHKSSHDHHNPMNTFPRTPQHRQLSKVWSTSLSRILLRQSSETLFPYSTAMQTT